MTPSCSYLNTHYCPLIHTTLPPLSLKHQSPLDLQALLKIEPPAVAGHMFATRNAQHPHLGIITQSRQKLGCDEEVLRCVLAAGNLHHTLVDHAFVSGVHTLIDLINDAEGGLSHRLKSHEVEDC